MGGEPACSGHFILGRGKSLQLNMKAYFYSESHLYIFIESKYNLCIHPPPKKNGFVHLEIILDQVTCPLLWWQCHCSCWSGRTKQRLSLGQGCTKSLCVYFTMTAKHSRSSRHGHLSWSSGIKSWPHSSMAHSVVSFRADTSVTLWGGRRNSKVRFTNMCSLLLD